MDTLFTFVDLQHFIGIKIVFFVFLLVSIWGIYKKKSVSFFAWTGGITCAAAYTLLVNDLELMFWGLKADEITIAAMYQQFAHGGLNVDFNYGHLVPFYPSLFFQLFAVVGKVLDFNGVQMAKVAAAATMAVFPALLLYVQKIYWSQKRDTKAPGALAWLVGVVCVFVFAGWDAVITKPYELVSASLVVLWTALLLVDLYTDKLTTTRAIVYGIVGGVLFWMFYFWFFLAAIGVALFNVFQKEPRVEIRHYSQLFLVGIVALIIAAPFWAPLVRTYALHGAENWQLGFFTFEWIATYVPEFVFSFQGIGLLLGVVALIWWRKYIYVRALLSLFAAGFVWQIMGLITIAGFSSPLQESKGYLFWSTAILAFALGYGVERLWFLHKDKLKEHTASAALVGLVLVTPQLLFGTFVDTKEFYEVRHRARSLQIEERELVDALSKVGVSTKTTLTSGIPKLHAFLPLQEYIYFNQHNSHPAAQFSERLLFVEELTHSSSSAELYDKIRMPETQIDLFVWYKGGERSDAYPLYFNLDNFPYRIEEKVFYIPKYLFSDEYFTPVYENDAYIIIEPHHEGSTGAI